VIMIMMMMIMKIIMIMMVLVIFIETRLKISRRISLKIWYEAVILHDNIFKMTTQHLVYWEFVSFDSFSKWTSIIFFKVISPFIFINVIFFCEGGLKLLYIIQLNSPCKC
jgi:hypothetical protein